MQIIIMDALCVSYHIRLIFYLKFLKIPIKWWIWHCSLFKSGELLIVKYSIPLVCRKLAVNIEIRLLWIWISSLKDKLKLNRDEVKWSKFFRFFTNKILRRICTNVMYIYIYALSLFHGWVIPMSIINYLIYYFMVHYNTILYNNYIDKILVGFELTKDIPYLASRASLFVRETFDESRTIQSSLYIFQSQISVALCLWVSSVICRPDCRARAIIRLPSLCVEGGVTCIENKQASQWEHASNH